MTDPAKATWVCPSCANECDTEKRCPECYYRRPDHAGEVDNELPDPKSVQLLLDEKPHLRVGRIMQREDALTDALIEVAMADQVTWGSDEIESLVEQLEGSTDRLDDWLAIRT